MIGAAVGSANVSGAATWCSSAISLVGVALVAIGSAGTPAFNVWGDLFAFASVFTWTAYWLFSKRARASVGALEYMTSVMLVAAVLMTFVALVSGRGSGAAAGRRWTGSGSGRWRCGAGAIGHVLLAWSHRHVEAWLGSLDHAMHAGRELGRGVGVARRDAHAAHDRRADCIVLAATAAILVRTPHAGDRRHVRRRARVPRSRRLIAVSGTPAAFSACEAHDDAPPPSATSSQRVRIGAIRFAIRSSCPARRMHAVRRQLVVAHERVPVGHDGVRVLRHQAVDVDVHAGDVLQRAVRGLPDHQRDVLERVQDGDAVLPERDRVGVVRAELHHDDVGPERRLRLGRGHRGVRPPADHGVEPDRPAGERLEDPGLRAVGDGVADHERRRRIARAQAWEAEPPFHGVVARHDERLLVAGHAVHLDVAAIARAGTRPSAARPAASPTVRR